MKYDLIYDKTIQITPNDNVQVEARSGSHVFVTAYDDDVKETAVLVLDSQETNALIAALCEARDALWAETQALDEV